MTLFRRIALVAILALNFSTLWVIGQKEKSCPNTSSPFTISVPNCLDEPITTYHPTYVSIDGEEENVNIQCPIPMKDRVRNHTGIQCVYSSIECLGRWAEEPKLTNPELTSRSECKGYSGPSQAAKVLDNLHVKFEQSYQSREEGIKLIKKAMKDGRACLWGVPGHAMVLCHYDEESDTVKWIDNSDKTLKIQTTTVAKFKARWDSWILVIYPDKEIFPGKAGGSVLNKIPIVDHNNPQGKYPNGYIPSPGK